MVDEVLSITPEMVEGLRKLRAEAKFHERDLYPGAPDEDIRAASESKINTLLESLLEGLKAESSKGFVVSEFRAALATFEGDDTEEREEACDYCGRVMEILGIEGSDGVLNEWLYGSQIADEMD